MKRAVVLLLLAPLSVAACKNLTPTSSETPTSPSVIEQAHVAPITAAPATCPAAAPLAAPVCPKRNDDQVCALLPVAPSRKDSNTTLRQLVPLNAWGYANCPGKTR